MVSIIFYLLNILLTVFIISYTSRIIYLQLIPGAFYYPTTLKDVQTIFKFIHPKSNDIFIDLGSGDGRIVIAAAQQGIKSIGYELDPILIHKSRQKINNFNLSHLAQIKAQNFWKIDFNQANIINIYQFPKYMDKFEKILKQVNHPITVISNQYPFPHQKPFLIKDKLYFYKFP